MKKYGIMVEIYRPHFGNALNKFKDRTHVMVPTDKPMMPASLENPAVKIVTGSKDGGEYIYAEPLIKEDGEWFGFGWTFIYSSSERFPSKHPIPLHDLRMNLQLHL